MVKGDLVKAGDFDKIQELTKEAKELAKSIRQNIVMHSIYRIEEKELVSKNDTSSFFLYTILIQENISLHYLFIIKDIMMIKSKSHKII